MDNHNRRNSVGPGRPVMRVTSRRHWYARRRNRRIMIVLTGIVALAIVVTVLVLIISLFTSSPKVATTPTEAQGDVEMTTAATEAPTYDVLNFSTPAIKDDGSSTGYTSPDNAGVYIYNNMALELFGGSEFTATDYASAISDFKASAPDYKVYNMVVPTHTEFALPQRLIDSGDAYSTSQADNLKAVYSNYTQDVQPINCYNAMCDHIDEYLYFNTDHHWSGLGAYYAYEAFCEQTGQTPLKLSDCEEHTIEGFTGSLYEGTIPEDTVHYWKFPYQTHAMCQPEAGDEMQEMSIYYDDAGPGSNTYGVFIFGDSSLFIEYNDDLSNGKKIAVVKESFGNAFVPYLTNNYEEVHVIDFRYFNQSLKSYMDENDIDEILFINNVMSANTALQVDRIREIF